MSNYKGHPNLAHMLLTHTANYRNALVFQRGHAKDSDDRSWFDHELSALTDIELAAKQEQTAAQPQAVEGLPEPVAEIIGTGPHDREDRVICELVAELPAIGSKLYSGEQVNAMAARIAWLGEMAANNNKEYEKQLVRAHKLEAQLAKGKEDLAGLERFSMQYGEQPTEDDGPLVRLSECQAAFAAVWAENERLHSYHQTEQKRADTLAHDCKALRAGLEEAVRLVRSINRYKATQSDVDTFLAKHGKSE